LGLKAFAWRLGLSLRQAQNHVADGLPVTREGRVIRVDWAAGFQWYLDRQRELAARGAMPEAVAAAKERRAEATAKIAEVQAARVEGRVIDLKDAESWAASILAAVSEGLRAAPGRFAPRCVNLTSAREARQVWEVAAREILADVEAALADAQVDGEGDT
jgi:phage terminase Nu1 subunit (DNA packaging protein)